MQHERNLHIGGTQQKAGWEIFNIAAGDNVDHVGNAMNMSRFADHTFHSIYASHILEHFDYYKELSSVLLEWKRILNSDGTLLLSVPDMDVIGKLISDDSLTVQESIYAMRMIFGGQTTPYDYHKVGFNFRILHWYLHRTGFERIIRVDSFNLFRDSSTKIFKGKQISLNVIARKPAN
ncbi:MAG: methyltransferase domain-containing protein [Desulfovibrionales bacterium]|nr:MAG: methyltransferase domain-containing protein [Desulfovibrionales bacterium]